WLQGPPGGRGPHPARGARSPRRERTRLQPLPPRRGPLARRQGERVSEGVKSSHRPQPELTDPEAVFVRVDDAAERSGWLGSDFGPRRPGTGLRSLVGPAGPARLDLSRTDETGRRMDLVPNTEAIAMP